MRRIYEFGEYQLDVSAFELRRDGVRVDVQPKMLRLLCHLIECRERAVSGDELMRLLWPEETVGTGSLKRAVCGARHAIGERGGRGSRIRTIHRFGYQFVGPLRETVCPGSAPAAALEQPSRNAIGRGDLQWGTAVTDAELLELLQRTLMKAKPSACCVTISSRAAGAGRTHTLDRLMTIVRPLVGGAWTARCAPRSGAKAADLWAQLVQQAAQSLNEQDFSAICACSTCDQAHPSAACSRLHSFGMLLQRAAERGPIVIGIDDAHQADITSLSRLRTQLQELKGVRVLLIATSRATASSLEVETLCAELSTQRISLSGLGQAELRHYVALATGTAPSDRLVNALHKLSAGNPLFLRLLLGIWRVEGRRTWSELVRPLLGRQDSTGVFELVTQYLKLLPEQTVRMLHIAALLGSSFSAERLASLAVLPATQQAQGLARASAAGLIIQDHAHRDTYRFVHTAVRAAVQARPTAASALSAKAERKREEADLLRSWQPNSTRASALGRAVAKPLTLRASASGFYSTRATRATTQRAGDGGSQ